MVVAEAACGGEIAGLRPQSIQSLPRDLDATFINDFLGRGGSVDDFRTQQSIISTTFSDRWLAVLDHSILTLTDEPSPGRIDQLSVSLGYELLNHNNDGRSAKLIIGTGLRNIGQFGGERIQNGFHRIVGSSIEELDYTGDTETDLTIWADTEHYRMLRDAADKGLFKNWRTGYQVRAASLVTTGGQWDSTLGVQVIISKPAADIWLGIRSDWRSGYDTAILRETAHAEEDTALVFGARIGPVVIETVQQFNNKASYGQIRLVSSPGNDRHGRGHRLGADFSVLVPDVQMRLAGRIPVRILTADASRWHESIVVGLEYGKPQYQNETAMFSRNRQVDVGIELERPLSGHDGWLSTYVSAGAGWRDEKLTLTGDSPDESAAAVGRAVLTASAGMRASVFDYRDGLQVRLQFGLVARLPVDGANAQIGDQSFKIQRSAVDLILGASINFN
jgi:hypothetical protein